MGLLSSFKVKEPCPLLIRGMTGWGLFPPRLRRLIKALRFEPSISYNQAA
jgi:hypothetical protein